MTARTGRSSDVRERFWVVAIVLSGYSMFAAWTLPFSADALTNALTAWHLGVRGTPFLTGAEAGDMWIVEGARGPVSSTRPARP